MRTGDPESAKGLGKKLEVEVRQISDVQLTGVAAAQALHVVDAFFRLGQQTLRIAQERPPFGSQSDLVLGATEKAYPEFCLEVVNLASERWLGQTQILGSFGKIQSVRDSYKIAKMTQFHVTA